MFLSISQGSFPVPHIRADTCGLVHNMQHVHIAVLKPRTHILLAELTDLQQLTRGFVVLGPLELLDDIAHISDHVIDSFCLWGKLLSFWISTLALSLSLSTILAWAGKDVRIS